jgi:hypothetical protein
LTAASTGITPSDWRLGLGSIDIQELPAWAWLAWFLSKFFDAARQQDGLALTVVQEALDMPPATTSWRWVAMPMTSDRRPSSGGSRSKTPPP